MGVRSKRLWGFVSLSSGAATLVYTASSGETALLKYLVVNNQPGANPVTLELCTNNAFNSNVFFREVVPAGEVRRYEMWIVIPQNGEVYAKETGSANARCAGHGAELEGVAD